MDKKTMQTKIQNARTEHKKKCQELINDVISMTFNNEPDLNFFVLKGYTPNFNDGDPCVHRQYIDDLETDEEFSGHNIIVDEYTYDVTLKMPDGKLLTTKNIKDFDVIKYLQEEFEQVYGTDWKILFVRDDNAPNGFFSIQKSWYCGH